MKHVVLHDCLSDLQSHDESAMEIHRPLNQRMHLTGGEYTFPQDEITLLLYVHLGNKAENKVFYYYLFYHN